MGSADDQCKEITLLDDSILMAAMIENANLVGSFARKPMVPPNEQRFKVLRIQTELMVSMAKNNEDFFGELGYLMFHSKLLDVFLFPVSKGKKMKILAVMAKRPYSHEGVAGKVLAHLAKTKD